ncbi:unnamed protein product, partial [Urochloa humidicola]
TKNHITKGKDWRFQGDKIGDVGSALSVILAGLDEKMSNISSVKTLSHTHLNSLG